MTTVEKMAAIEFSGQSAADCAAFQMTLALLKMADELGGIEAVRRKVDAVIADGMATKKFKKWVKAREVLA